MDEQARPRKATAAVVGVLMVALACLAVTRVLSLSSSKSQIFGPSIDLMRISPKPDFSTLAPGAWSAVRKALGDDGLNRITTIISPTGSISINPSHWQSGTFQGRPYGLAFDIAVADEPQGEANARALRLQGVAAWYRGPGVSGFGGGEPHLHCVWPGAPTNNPINLQQIASFAHGYLAQPNEDAHKQDWKDPSIRPDEIACVTRAYYSIPRRKPLDKITTYDALHAVPASKRIDSPLASAPKP